MTEASRRLALGVLGVVVLGVCSLGCADQRLPAPVLLQPEQGAATGSVWAPASLTPLFQWTAVAGASSYELQVDDSCATPVGCPFPTPEIGVTVQQPRYQAPPLAVSSVAPVGRRYSWRVRACADSCGGWSPTFLVDVGRQNQDFNGDGYADLVIGASGATEPSGAFVYLGGPAFSATSAPSWTVSSTDGLAVGYQATWLGDVDGDGFAELAYLAARPTDTGQASLNVVRILRWGGSPGAVVAQEISTEAITLLRPAGDVNGDGFRDLYLNAQVSGQSIHLVYLGSASLQPLGAGMPVGLYPDPGHFLGSTDLNDDGALDLIFERVGGAGHDVVWGDATAAPFQPIRTASLNLGADDLRLIGKGVVDLGGTIPVGLVMSGAQASSVSTPFALQGLSAGGTLPSSACDGRLPAPPSGLMSIADGAVVGDTDGDGYADFVVGDAVTTNNRSVLYYGGCPATRFLVLPGGDNGQGGGFAGTGARPATGAAVAAAGDLNGDGYPDIVVGNPYTTEDGPGTGEAYVYFGGPGLSPAPAVVLTNPINTTGAADGFGRFVD